MSRKMQTNPAKAQADSCSSFQIPRLQFASNFDRLMTAQRLTLALHRMVEKKSPEQILAWEIFNALNSACDELGTCVGYGPEEMDPE